jgi:hypothetical protein
MYRVLFLTLLDVFIKSEVFMSVMSNQVYLNDVEGEIVTHSAWEGSISGLEAEALLKGQSPFTYVLRAGETYLNYYVSFVGFDHMLRHQPFKIMISQNGWSCMNGNVNGPFLNTPFFEILHLIMHCEKGECNPLNG